MRMRTWYGGETEDTKTSAAHLACILIKPDALEQDDDEEKEKLLECATRGVRHSWNATMEWHSKQNRSCRLLGCSGDRENRRC